MPAPDGAEAFAYAYTVVRVVPSVEREELINAGVIVFCRPSRYLGARVFLDRTRLIAFAPTLDLEEVERRLALIERICAGGRAAGPFAAFSLSERFYWLAAPRSTTIQTSPVHFGLTRDAAASLEQLFSRLVSPTPI